jgi:hypothetical protein
MKAWALHGKSKHTETEERRERRRTKWRAYSSFYLPSRVCSQRIRPGRPNSQFRILFWRFKAAVWKCAQTSPRNLATKKLTVASRQCKVSLFLFPWEFLPKYNMTVVLHPPYFLLFPRLKINWKTAILTQLRWSRQNRRRCWTPSQNTTSRMHLRNVGLTGNVAYARKRVLRVWW